MERSGRTGRNGRDGGGVPRAAHTAYQALEARLPVTALGRTTLRKVFPDHWSFLLGELALYSFLVLLLTGVYLTLFFHPDMTQTLYTGSHRPLRGLPMSEAYASTLHISFDVRGGLLVRQIHHWAALLFVAAICLHLLRVFFTGAFRKPRELNWTVGVTLFLLALAEGFCGYSLPDDLLSGTGLRIAQGIMQSVPVVGTYLSFFVFDGEYPGHAVIPRLYVLHVLLLPALLVALVICHLLLVFHLKHTAWPSRHNTQRQVAGQPMYPQFSAKSGGLFFLVFGILALLAGVAQINPIWAYGPYRADHVSTYAQPDWYVGFLEGSLRLMPRWDTVVAGHTLGWNVLVPAVLLPAALFAVLYLYPFFERWLTADPRDHHLCDRPRDRPTRTGLGVAGIVCYAVLLMAGGNDLIAVTFDLSLNALTWTLRIALLVAPPLAFMLTSRMCRALTERERNLLTDGEETGHVRQSVDGGFHAEHGDLPAERRHAALAGEVPRPLRRTGADRPRDRLRAVLSAWYHREPADAPPGTDPQEAGRGAAPAGGRDTPDQPG